MKCLQKLYSSPSWLVVSLCLLCTLFLIMTNTTSVSAVSDYSGSFDATTFPFVLCYSSDTPSYSPQCSDYDTIIFHITTPATDTNNARIFQVVNNSNSKIYGINAFIDSSLDISDISAQLSIVNQYSFGAGRFDYTLTNSSSSAPSGTLFITENGTFDVTSYAFASVDVPPEIQQGDYHDDLVNLKQAIILVPAVCLVIYFFYAIYKMIMGGVRR